MNLDDFFYIHSAASYPRKMKLFDKFVYWSNWRKEWRKYIYFQKYKKYDIW